MRALLIALMLAGCVAKEPVRAKLVTTADYKFFNPSEYYYDPALLAAERAARPHPQRPVSCHSSPDGLGGVITNCY